MAAVKKGSDFHIIMYAPVLRYNVLGSPNERKWATRSRKKMRSNCMTEIGEGGPRGAGRGEGKRERTHVGLRAVLSRCHAVFVLFSHVVCVFPPFCSANTFISIAILLEVPGGSCPCVFSLLRTLANARCVISNANNPNCMWKCLLLSWQGDFLAIFLRAH